MRSEKLGVRSERLEVRNGRQGRVPVLALRRSTSRMLWFRRLLLFSLLTSHFSLLTQAQTWQLVRTIALPQPGAASLDRRGTLYVADARDNIHQYGPEGQALNTFSPPQPGHVAQLEAWNTTKILLFYDDRQELLLLDRFAAPLTQFSLFDFLDGGLARAATLAPDDRYWLLIESDLTLRQFDPTQKRFVVNTPLDLLIGRSKADFRFLREYQNNLYLVDRTTALRHLRVRQPGQLPHKVAVHGPKHHWLPRRRAVLFRRRRRAAVPPL